MAEINPYQAPQASLQDPGAVEGILAAEPRRVDAGRGLAWLTEGWILFRQAPLPWIGITLVAIVIFLVFTSIFAGLWIGARDVKAGAMTPGELVQFVIYAVMVAGSVAALGREYQQQGYKILPDAYIKMEDITAQWDEMLRFIATIKLKEATASQLFNELTHG